MHDLSSICHHRGVVFLTTDRLAERRFEALVQSMVEKLSADGAVMDSVQVLEASGVPEAVEKWRAAGRAAAGRLNLPVHTGISRDGRVWVEVFDKLTEPRDQSAVDWITEVLLPASKDYAGSSDFSGV
jgi:hypothetical protein